ncbi:hypothetical protein AK830_g3323 [Neonectria ditissima]|uniref:beta-glucosidase n=1 Tax=Neonectria ditissima TaxID=78410 RepID=A0A0P7AZS6_9HYPO|nr:hypothetical protein AK830_g3323 [Neonectria ditissima]
MGDLSNSEPLRLPSHTAAEPGFDVEQVLKELNSKEKIDLLSGIDFWHTKAVPRLNVPSIRLSDGPNGVRGTRFFNGVPAACFPCGTGLAATWNTNLLQSAGGLMGAEARAKGVHVLLGPTVNMQRSPLGGRAFESFSEDPVLAGRCAASIIAGIEKTGVVASVKHFVANDQEHERMAVDSLITERALREIYVLPFQIAVRDANPGSFMTSYNKVNGVHVSDSPDFIQKIVRGEWVWEGMVMSDCACGGCSWYGGNETGNAIADVLFGDVNPSGKLPLSFPVGVEDNPAFLNYRSEHGRVLYGEDVYIGYRFYEAVKRQTQWSFGWGLSYTSFVLSDLQLQQTTNDKGELLVITVTVQNTGEVDGSGELKGFAKVHVEKGSSAKVEVAIERKYATSFWDETLHKWTEESGFYDILVGSCSAETPLKQTFEVKETVWWSGL